MIHLYTIIVFRWSLFLRMTGNMSSILSVFFFAGLPTGKKYREELRRKRKREQEKAELQQTEHKTKRQGNSMG